MPNLAGMFCMKEELTDAQDVLGRFTRVLRVPGVEYTTREWHDTRFVAVNMLNGLWENLDQPVSVGDKVLFLDGEISNLPQVRDDAEVFPAGGASASAAVSCLQMYERHGDEFVKRLSGQFNILIYDRARRTVSIFNDRFGYRPMYYWCADGVAVFGLEKKAIFAALERTPPFGAAAVMEFFIFGHNVGERTLFEGVRVMPPGSVVDFREGGVQSRRYWRPVYPARGESVSLEDGARELARRLDDAVTRWTRTPRQYGIFLSGGLDSRAVAGALSRTGREISSFTIGDDDSADLVFGREIANQLGFRFHRLYEKETLWSSLVPQVVWRTEGSIPFNEAGSIADHRNIRSCASILFNGHIGDILSGACLRPAQFSMRNERQLVRHILAHRTLLPLSTVRALFRESVVEELYAEIMEGLIRSVLETGENRIALANSIWMLTVRAHRFTFCSPAVDRYVVEFVTPFTDNDVVDWMLRMPLRHLIGQRMYKRMIVESSPRIAGVPWARTGRPLAKSVAVDMTHVAWAGARKRIRRLTSTGRRAVSETRLRDLKSHVETRLDWDAFPDSLFDRSRTRALVQRTLDESTLAPFLFPLLTFAECTRLFSSGAVTQAPRETWPDL